MIQLKLINFYYIISLSILYYNWLSNSSEYLSGALELICRHFWDFNYSILIKISFDIGLHESWMIALIVDFFFECLDKNSLAWSRNQSNSDLLSFLSFTEINIQHLQTPETLVDMANSCTTGISRGRKTFESLKRFWNDRKR